MVGYFVLCMLMGLLFFLFVLIFISAVACITGLIRRV